MEIPLTEEPPHFKELCRQVGFAVLQAQLVESSLARYLVLHLRLEESVAADQVSQALDSADRKTIGNLLKRIDKKCPLPSGLTDRLCQFCDDRNWLVHRLNRENELATFREEHAVPVFDRIQNLSRMIGGLMVDLDSVGDEMMDKHGFNSQEIKQQALRDHLEKTSQQPD